MQYFCACMCAYICVRVHTRVCVGKRNAERRATRMCVHKKCYVYVNCIRYGMKQMCDPVRNGRQQPQRDAVGGLPSRLRRHHRRAGAKLYTSRCNHMIVYIII
jgi:hypothetical protein